MSVGLRTGPLYYKLGAGSFVHAFFSTIAYRLENNQWGSRFPHLMNRLYRFGLTPDGSKQALEELRIIRQELSELPPDQIIWDIEDMSARPPWDTKIAASITDMSNYFITSDGKQLPDVLTRALETSVSIRKPVKIQ